MIPARCECGECGGVALLAVGTVVGFRGKPARVATWNKQDHWNVPCLDAEGALSISRDDLDGGPGYTLDDVNRAVRRSSDLSIAAIDPAERKRLIADCVAWCDLHQRLLTGAPAARLNPDAATA